VTPGQYEDDGGPGLTDEGLAAADLREQPGEHREEAPESWGNYDERPSPRREY
jgi:hypothetical protein